MPVRDRTILSTLCLLAIFAALACSQSRGITLDEATSLYWSYQVFHFDFHRLFQEIHTPSYDIALGGWLSLFGFTLEAAKGLSMVFGAMAVATTYRLARSRFDARTALFSTALLATAPLLAFYSQYVRTYALFIAAAALSSLYYLALLREPTRKHALLYLVSTYLLVCSHIVAFTLVAVQWIHFAALKRRSLNWRAWLGLQAGLFALYSPFLIIILTRYNLVTFIPQVYAWVPKPGPMDLLNAFVFLSGSNLALTLLLALLAITGLGFGLGRQETSPGRPSEDERSTLAYLCLWLLVPMAMLFVYSYLHHPIFIARGFAASIVPWAMLAGRGLARLRREFSLALLIAVIALSGVSVEKKWFGEQEDWRRASEMARPGPVFVSPSYAALPFSYYFKRECFLSPDVENCLKRLGVTPIDHYEELHLTAANPAWLIGYTVARAENDRTLELLKRDPHVQIESERIPLYSIDLSRFAYHNR